MLAVLIPHSFSSHELAKIQWHLKPYLLPERSGRQETFPQRDHETHILTPSNPLGMVSCESVIVRLTASSDAAVWIMGSNTQSFLSVVAENHILELRLWLIRNKEMWVRKGWSKRDHKP